MAGVPPADVVITEHLIRTLLETSPWPAPTTVRFVARGFDNETWWADGRGLRLPRRAFSVAAVRNEQRWLNDVVSRLPLETPAVIYRGEPTEGFPYPWSLTHFVEGETAMHLTAEQRGQAAGLLGTALRTLHQPAPADAPTNPFRGVALDQRRENLIERLALVDEPTRETVLRWFNAGTDVAPHRGRSVWLHGDIHPGNLIVRDGELVGLIDFSDLCAGDPAVDLGGALFSLPPSSHDELWGHYGSDDESFHARAYGWAALLALLHLQIELAEHTALAHDALAWLEVLR